MTTYFITRHPGAITWAQAQGIIVDQQLAHLDVNQIKPEDVVIGSLPVNLAAQVCERGAMYIHMSMTVPEAWRGKELTMQQMQECGARLEAFDLKKVPCLGLDAVALNAAHADMNRDEGVAPTFNQHGSLHTTDFVLVFSQVKI